MTSPPASGPLRHEDHHVRPTSRRLAQGRAAPHRRPRALGGSEPRAHRDGAARPPRHRLLRRRADLCGAEGPRRPARRLAQRPTRGSRKGERVLLYMQNSPHFVIAYYAILRADAVVVPVNPMNRVARARSPGAGHRRACGARRRRKLLEHIAPLIGTAAPASSSPPPMPTSPTPTTTCRCRRRSTGRRRLAVRRRRRHPLGRRARRGRRPGRRRTQGRTTWR